MMIIAEYKMYILTHMALTMLLLLVVSVYCYASLFLNEMIAKLY